MEAGESFVEDSKWIAAKQLKVHSKRPGSQSAHRAENVQADQDCLSAFQCNAIVQVQHAVRIAGAQLAADPRTLFIQKTSASIGLRAGARAGEDLTQLAVAAAKGHVPDAKTFLSSLRKALRGFLKRPGSAASRTRQHSTYAAHAHALRWDLLTKW